MKKVLLCLTLGGCGFLEFLGLQEPPPSSEWMQLEMRSGYEALDRRPEESLDKAERLLSLIAQDRRLNRWKREASRLKNSAEIQIAFAEGDLERARKMLREMMERNPQYEWAERKLAEVEKRISFSLAAEEAQSKGDFDRALSLLDAEYTRLAKPKCGRPFMNRIFTFASDDPSEREEARLSAEAMKGRHLFRFEDFLKRADCWASAGNLRAAIGDVRAATKASDFAEAWRHKKASLFLTLARFLGASGDFDGALREIDRATLLAKEKDRESFLEKLTLQPLRPRLRALRGAILARLDREREAVRELKEAVRILHGQR